MDTITQYKTYHCPVCGQSVVRDLTIFMNHAHHHVLDEITRLHPEVVSVDGGSIGAETYYQQHMHCAA